MTLLADSGAQSTEQVVSWRVQRLRRAGFPPGLAVNLAVYRRYDLHALLDLVERGCPPALAAGILEPLPDGCGTC